MNKALQDLINISNKTGKDATLVQGGGGNTSAKTPDGKYMYIKASGTALKDMDKNKGWRRLRVDSVLEIIDDQRLLQKEAQKRELEVVERLLDTCDDDVQGPARPSVEAHLHALLDRYVIHLHPDAVNAYANAKNGRAKLERLFGNSKKPPLWVPYTDPGLLLARKIRSLVEDYKKNNGFMPQVLFLEKHGLFVTAGSANQAMKIVRDVINTCSKPLKSPAKQKNRKIDSNEIYQAKLTIRAACYKATGEYHPVSYFTDATIDWFMRSQNAGRMLATEALTPDELIYANGPAFWVKKLDADKLARLIQSLMEKGKKAPAAFLVRPLGLFIAAPAKMAVTIKDIAASSFFVRMNAYSMGGIAALNKRQREFINNWEAEAFRKSLAAGPSSGLIKDRIAVVTGAGSGIGRSIAIGMARAGAYVALADIDQKAVTETQQMIKEELPGACTDIIACNVTDEKSVSEFFDRLLDRWGGLDILVNAAGIAPPFSMLDLPVQKWRLALEVNLTGYFLMAQAAARIMVRQDMGGSIINISSKSGLEASKNNTPYNATKAGELHMARGWAMELGKHNIRVNSICPGNVFEGSKIWNEDYIKVCAKKYGIKPEEVIPYYVSRTMLNREIKGQDIADSVVFLCSDQAQRITAQTLVVDAGQVPVR